MRANEADLNNFKAHRAQLLGEVSVANAELAEVLKQKQEAEASCAAAVKREREAEEHLAFLLVDVRDAENTLADLRKETDETRVETARLIREAELAVAQADAHILSLEEGKKNLETDITALEKAKASLAVEYASCNESYASLCKNIEERRREHQEWHKLSLIERSDARARLSAAEHNTKKEEEKLAEVQALVAAEIKKIEEPSKSLARDFATVSRMRRNVDVYAARVKRKHAELYPDKPFII